MTDLILHPRDPILVRDGRPFGVEPGGQARTLPWPLPQTVAGAVRTWAGNSLGWDWRGDGPAKALAVSFAGPLLVRKDASDTRSDKWLPFFPRPLDAVAGGEAKDGSTPLVRLAPYSAPTGAGAIWPDGASLLPLKPCAGQPAAKASLPRYWSTKAITGWLCGGTAELPEHDAIGELGRENRVHVAVNPHTGTAVESALFSTEGLAFGPGMAMLCRVSAGSGQADLGSLPDHGVLTLGGERRMTLLQSAADGLWPVCPDGLKEHLTGAKRITLYLASPGLFDGGWKPGWLNEDLVGSPPSAPLLRLKLVSAAVGRFEPVSGWSYDKASWGPKKARRAAPAGSAYFFEVAGGGLTPEDIDRLWLQPVSDDEQDRRDGYGLAMPGLWDMAEGGAQ